MAAWPVNSFVKENDFTNKTVIPFCTSFASLLGQSDELLKKWLIVEIGKNDIVLVQMPVM